MFKVYAGISIVLAFVIMTSGCINIDPEAIAKANPVIQEFLREHPNADLRIIHYSANESVDMIDLIRDECGKDTIEPKEFYLVNVTEPGYMGVAWVDWEAQTVECAFKISYVQEPECVSHSKTACHGEHVYWFDSCGNKEEKKEYCAGGCMNGACVGEQNQCKSHAEKKCYDGNVYWYNSCGNKEEKVEYCNYGCENGFCKDSGNNECYDSDGGKNYYEKGTAKNTKQELSDHCNSDGTLTEKYCTDNGGISAEIVQCDHGCQDAACIAEGCTSHDEYGCYEGHVYWYNSCGNREEKKEYCQDGCEDSACIVPNETQCVNETHALCWEGDLWWYDSCESRGALKQDCDYGCENASCVEEPENSCSDSDGGLVYNVTGYLEMVVDGSPVAELYDYCEENGTSLYEYYCSGSEGLWEYYVCPSGCENGMCLNMTA